MNQKSLEQLYSLKTDDELLALTADGASLREEARSILASELQRRNLDALAIASEQIPNHAGAKPFESRFMRALRFGGALILNTCVAVLGTAFLETEIGRVFHPHSLAGLLWKLWGLELSCAAVIGFFMWRTWEVNATKWTWVLPAVWFGLRLVPVVLSPGRQSVLAGTGIWSQFSGADCVRASGCTNFFAFTAPFIRSVSYSIGASLSSILKSKVAIGG